MYKNDLQLLQSKKLQMENHESILKKESFNTSRNSVKIR